MKRLISLGIAMSLILSTAWGQDGGEVSLINIKWGMKTRTQQVWDGHVEVGDGTLLSILPYQRNEKPDETMRASENSWHSTTYTDAEGVYLFVSGTDRTRISVFTGIHDFAFPIGGIKPGETSEELDGEIEIKNESDRVLFRISGLENGVAGKGTATISPASATADTLGTWTLTYTAPEGGIPAGGGVRMSWHFTHSWGTPQFDDPQGVNYSTVRTTGGSTLDYTSEHMGIFEYPFSRGRTLVRIMDEPLKEGEQIVVTLGDRSQGSPGFESPRISEGENSIRVEECTTVPRGEFPVYYRIRELPVVTVRPSEPHHFFVVAPSLVAGNEPFDLKVSVEDSYRNAVRDFAGDLEVKAGDTVIARTAMTRDDKGMVIIPGIVLDEPGVYWLTVQHTKSALSGESNPIECREKKPDQVLVWGETHGHTAYSDGFRTLDDYYTFARNRAFLDFASATDHDVELDAPDYDVKEMWKEANAVSARHHDPPAFCTTPAYEWSPARKTASTMAPYGDHNVFFEREGMPIFQARNEGSNSLPGLYESLGNIDGCRVGLIPHVGGAVANWEFHDPELETLAEIYSVHGCFEEFGRSALERGYIVGFVGAADSHSGQMGGFGPGNVPGHYTHGGLAAAFVPELSREALFDTFRKRHAYATSGERIILDFSIDDNPMGSIVETETTPVIRGRVLGTAPILWVEVIKNGKVIHTSDNTYEENEEVTLLWGNRVEADDLKDFDRSLWSYDLRHVDWAGGILADSGTIELTDTLSFDFPNDGIVKQTDEEIQWTSKTRGDWDGVTVRTGKGAGNVRIALGEYTSQIDLTTLENGLTRKQLGVSDTMLLVRGTPRERALSFEIKDQSILYKHNYYYMRVLQANGEMAWSSPIWIREESEERAGGN